MLGFDEGGESFRAGDPGFALSEYLLDNLGSAEHLCDFLVQPQHNRLRCFRRNDKTVPAFRLVTRNTGFGNRRNLRELLRPACGAYCQSAQTSGIDIGHQTGGRGEGQLHFSGHQINDRRTVALVRHVQQLDFSHRLQQTNREMPRSTNPRRPIGQLPRPGARQSQKLLQ